MKPIRILTIPAALLVLAAAGCDTNDAERVVDQETEVFTEPTTETVEVERMTEDTFLVETQTEVSVDTTRIGEGDVGTEVETRQEETPTTNY